MRKYCPDPHHCTFSDCPTAFCDAKEPLVPASGSAIKCPRCEGTGTYTKFPGFVNVCAVCNGKGVVADDDIERAPPSEPWTEKGYMAGVAKGYREAIEGLRCIRKGLWTIDQYEAWLELCIISANGGGGDETTLAKFRDLTAMLNKPNDQDMPRR